MPTPRRVLRRARAAVRRRLPQPGPVPAPAGTGPLPVRHVGMTRFSLFSPASPSWRTTRQQWESPEEYAAHLFSEERMGPRVHIFCDLAVPLYQQMAERHGYHHLVAYSPELPERWRSRLEETARRYPVLRLVENEGDKVNWVGHARRLLREDGVDRDHLVFAFRVDDDDLLAVDYLDQVTPLVTPQHVGFAVSVATGYAGLYEDGRYTDLRVYRQLLPSMGQGAIGRWSSATSTLDLVVVKNHTRTQVNRPVLLDGRQPAWLQTRHVGQDTAVAEGGDVSDVAAARQAVLDKLDRLAPVEDLEEVYRRFPTLRGQVA